MANDRKRVDTEIFARVSDVRAAPTRVPEPVAGSAIVRPTVNHAVMPGHPAYAQQPPASTRQAPASSVNHAVMPGHAAYPQPASLLQPRERLTQVSPMTEYRHGRGGMHARPTGTGPAAPAEVGTGGKSHRGAASDAIKRR
jgi:hypothetical protein